MGCIEQDDDSRGASSLPTVQETRYNNETLALAQSLSVNSRVEGGFDYAGSDLIDSYQFPLTIQSNIDISLSVNGSLTMKLIQKETVIDEEDQSEVDVEVVLSETTEGRIQMELPAGHYYITLAFDPTERDEYSYTMTLVSDPLIDVPSDQRVSLYYEADESPICYEVSAYNTDIADETIIETNYQYAYGRCEGTYISQCLMPDVSGNHYVHYFSQDDAFDYETAKTDCEDANGVYTEIIVE